MKIDMRDYPTKRPELLVFEPSALRVGHVVIRDAEKKRAIHSHPSHGAAVRWARKNHYTWLDRVKSTSRSRREMVQA